MDFSKLDIKIENDKHSFVIEEKDISKIHLIFPFLYNDISADLSECDGQLFLQTYDQIASSLVGFKNYVQHFYSLNPFTKTVKIIVPKNSIQNLDICLENGNVFLHKVNIEKVNISSIRGNVKILDSNINSVIINGWESEIFIKNLEGKNCFAVTKTGNLILKKNLPDVTTLKSNIGDITVISEDQGVKYTLFDIESKYIQNSVYPTEQVQKIIRCVAPYGSVDVNIL